MPCRHDNLEVLKHKRIYLLFLLVPLAAWWFCLPDPLFDAAYSTVLLDRNEELLGARLAGDGQWRFPADELEVPETFAKAIVLFEDKRFYQHIGFDVLAFGRAVRDNISSGAVVSGGSTLTMQTMRLARNKKSRNLWQKSMEILWALRAEIRYSKKEIMRLYAAHAPFGGNVVGLEAASWRYYHKMPDQLSWGEAAALAVLPNAPALIHPGRNRDALLNKRNRLLERMAKTGIIDMTEASLAMNEPLPSQPQPLPDLAPHVLSHYTNSGQLLHTTIDIQLQQRLTELLQRHADINSLNGVNNAALMVMKTGTGEVMAYIGNVSHAQKAHQNDVDIIRSERSSGSILKPFLYCAALEEGLITPKGMVEDIPTYIRGYQPLNFTQEYMGMVPADEALAMSLNVPAVRMLQHYGIAAFKEKLDKAGITTLHFSPDHYGLPLVLGGAEVTLWDICGAYASMGRILSHAYAYDHRYARDDIHEPVLFGMKGEKEEGLKGKRTEGKENRSRDDVSELVQEAPVWNVGAIWQTFEAMRTLRRPDQEGQWETFSSSRSIAWKTGTSFGYRDAWAVGVTPSYTIGVWVGNADGEGRPGVIGLHAAAPVMFDVLRMLQDDGDWWLPPYDALEPKVVCAESGWLASSLCSNADTVMIPKQTNMPASCSFHQQVYTDSRHQFRYNPSCMPVDALASTFFNIPPLAEYYFRRYHPSYAPLPPWHPDCGAPDGLKQDMAIVYPRPGSKIYVPYTGDKTKSRAVFSAVHRSDSAYIYWHLDKQYIGKTLEFHQIEIDPSPGNHQLVLQDEYGSIVSTSFEVLNTK